MKRLSRLFDDEFLMRGEGERKGRWITTKRQEKTKEEEEEEEEGEKKHLSLLLLLGLVPPDSIS